MTRSQETRLAKVLADAIREHGPAKPRRPFDDEKPNGYLESDRDYMENNSALVIAVLDVLADEEQSHG